jgi:hypothetical protein
MITTAERIARLETKVKIMMIVLFAHVGVEAIPVAQAYIPKIIENITLII